MSLKAKYVLFTVLDFALTFGGTAGVIILNFLEKDTSVGYKLTLGGTVLVICLLFFAKAVFEHNYRNRLDNLLQQLAMATDTETKMAVNEKIEAQKKRNIVYQRITVLLPFAVLFIVTYLGANALEHIHQSAGLVLVTLGGGSIFNVVRKPMASQIQLNKLKR